jgi:putative DNA primase/helicase
MTTPTGKRLGITVATASPRKGTTMAHDATTPTAADLDAADARLRTLEARRATAGASCSSSDKAIREKALRLNAKLKGQIAQAKAQRDRLKTAARAATAAQSQGRAGDDKAVDWPTATQAFLNDARGLLAWVADRDRWAVWNGRCWAFDAKGAKAALVAQRWVRDCAEANGQPALRTRARAHHELLDHAKGTLLRAFRAFDAARVAHLLTVANGTIDLRTGELLPHDPTHLITRESPVQYEPEAAGEFPARLLEIFQGDASLADWFRREIGMAATGFDQAKRVYFLCGDLDRPDANGDNGKSLVVDTIRAALGSYAGGIKSALLCRPSFDRDANSHDAGRQGLIGNRLALGAEFPTGSRLNDAEFNELSGGEPIRARMPNQPDEIEFPAQATIIISTNTVPALGTANRSTRERLIPVPFFARFYKPGEPMPADGRPADYDLKARLLSEREQRAVLAWIVSGARDFYATGTPAPLPAAVLALKAHIFRQQDEFAEFLDDSTLADPAGSITRQDLRRLAEAHFGPMNRAAEMRLAAAMKARRYESVGADSAARRWVGVSVKTGAAAILGTMRSKATTVAPALRVVVSQAAPVPAPALVPVLAVPTAMGATHAEWDAAFAADADALTDPCPLDAEEEAARLAWLANAAIGGQPR